MAEPLEKVAQRRRKESRKDARPTTKMIVAQSGR
jgi:hypothetical protein